MPPPAIPGSDAPLVAASDGVEAGSPVDAMTLEIMASPIAQPLAQDVAVAEGESQSDNETAVETAQSQRINLVQKVRDWLRRAS